MRLWLIDIRPDQKLLCAPTISCPRTSLRAIRLCILYKDLGYAVNKRAISNHFLVTPMIPFLYDDLRSFYMELIGLSIKPEVLQMCRDDVKVLLKINLRSIKNHVKRRDMQVTFGAQQELLSILRKDSARFVSKFRSEAREFLITLLERCLIIVKLPSIW